MQIPRCSRTGDIVEKVFKLQWFFDSTKLSERLQMLSEILLLPKSFQQVWRSWSENLQPWCLSRQIDWGHKIPIYYLGSERHPVAAVSLEEAVKKFGKIEGDLGPGEIAQESDVLDSWFSSSLAPLFASSAPHSFVESGHDILFFWIQRMVLLSLALENRIPFRKIFLHPMVAKPPLPNFGS